MRCARATSPGPRWTCTPPSRWRRTTRFARAPNLVLTPHLGASTSEAQDRVGLEMAEQVVMALAGVTPPYAVNAPAVPPRDRAPAATRTSELGRRLAILARQLAPGAFDALSLTYAGEIAAGECAPIRTAALAGLLEAVTDQRVNAVNADLVAQRARPDRPRGRGRRRRTRGHRSSSSPSAPSTAQPDPDAGGLDRARPPAPRRARRLRDRRRAGRHHARDPPPGPAGHRRAVSARSSPMRGSTSARSSSRASPSTARR